MKGTDANEKVRVNGEVDQLINKFLEALSEKIKTCKEKIIADKAEEHKKLNTRKNIQERIDAKIYQRENKDQKSWYKYLTDPKRVI